MPPEKSRVSDWHSYIIVAALPLTSRHINKENRWLVLPGLSINGLQEFARILRAESLVGATTRVKCPVVCIEFGSGLLSGV